MDDLFRSVVVTGASSGIGQALALTYARPGVAMLLIARDADRAGRVLQACRDKGADVELALVDVRDTEALVARLGAFDRRSPVDLVIANAGVEQSLGPGRRAETLDSSIEQVRVNFEGAVATVTPFLDAMQRRRRGSIVLVASLAALEPLPDQPIYSATKAGLAAWGIALHTGLKRSGVRVCVVYPGFVRTGMAARYEGWRPFEVSAEDAALRIAAGVARRRSSIAFPWPLVWLIRLGQLVPRSIRDMILEGFFKFRIAP